MMSRQQATARSTGEPVGEAAEPRKSRFTLPSAYTILFALIVLMAIATWIIPAGLYALDEEGSPIPGTYQEVESSPSRIIVDSLEAPINGLYGIEDPATGNVDVFNSGDLFGAIDVALFILVIGGFIGITMKTGAIQAGIALLVNRLGGRERWMIPILMTVFAVGGTTFGMAEESLAFYVLVITVMIAAGYDALVGALVILLGAGIGVLGSTVNPFATGIASGFADVSDQRRPRAAPGHPRRRPRRRHLVRAALRRPGEARPVQVARLRHEGGQRTPLRRRRRRHRRGRPHRPAQAGPRSLRRRLRRDGLRGDPLGGPQHRPADAVVVVPRDDRLVPAVRHPHRARRQDEGGRAHVDVRRRRPRSPRRRADHRHRPRHHRRDEQRTDHRHRPVLVPRTPSATSARRPSPWSCTCSSCRSRSSSPRRQGWRPCRCRSWPRWPSSPASTRASSSPPTRAHPA